MNTFKALEEENCVTEGNVVPEKQTVRVLHTYFTFTARNAISFA